MPEAEVSHTSSDDEHPRALRNLQISIRPAQHRNGRQRNDLLARRLQNIAVALTDRQSRVITEGFPHLNAKTIALVDQ